MSSESRENPETRYFTSPYTWDGGFYELAIEVIPRSDSQLTNVLRALWAHPFLDGCYLNKKNEPSNQKRIPPHLITLESAVHPQSHLFGIANFSNGGRVACGTVPIREENGSDWLVFYIPMGALSKVYNVRAYPFDVPRHSPKHWQIPMDEWLATLGKDIYRTVPFALGLIGYEVSGDAYTSTIQVEGIPQHRSMGYLWSSEGKLEYYATNLFSSSTKST